VVDETAILACRLPETVGGYALATAVRSERADAVVLGAARQARGNPLLANTAVPVPGALYPSRCA
jgi:hypothetical protein